MRHVLSTLLLTLTLLDTSLSSDWKPIIHQLNVPWDLESTSVQVKTNYTEGSGDVMAMGADKDFRNGIGYLIVSFSSPIKYKIVGTDCPTKPRYSYFPVAPPTEVDKIWTIAKTEESLIISCNGVQLLEYIFSERSVTECASQWSGDVVGNIWFSDTNGYYREVPSWLPVERDTKIKWDLESTPLQIKTDSTEDSGDSIRVGLHSSSGRYIGTVRVHFNSPMKFRISGCSKSWIKFPVAPTSEVYKLWTISKTEESFIFACNGVQLLEYTFYESRSRNCASQWSGDVVGEVQFRGKDTASDYYKAPPKPYWSPVDHDEMIPWNLETTPLQIKTDSTEGSEEKISVRMNASSGSWGTAYDVVGLLEVKFSSPPMYRILCPIENEDLYSARNSGWCVLQTLTEFSTALPAEVDKIWTFAKTEERLIIFCNGVQVLSNTFHQQTWPSLATKYFGTFQDYCSDMGTDCASRWRDYKMGDININEYDTASDYYRAAPEPTEVWLR